MSTQLVSTASCASDPPAGARWTSSSTGPCIDDADDAQSTNGAASEPVNQGLEEEKIESIAPVDEEIAVVIPPVPHAASELRMAALLAELQQPLHALQPFWRDPRQLGLIAEINQLRGLPGPHAATMDVRLRNIETISMHPTWCSILPWCMVTLCKAITNGQHDQKFPLTVDGQQQLIPLSTIRRLDLSQALHMLVAEMSQFAKASINDHGHRARKLMENYIMDINLLGSIYYTSSAQQALSRLAQQSQDLTAPVYSIVWEAVKGATPISELQAQQIRMLLDSRQVNMEDISSNEHDILATLQETYAGGQPVVSSAELFDLTEDLLTAKALRFEIDRSLAMCVSSSVLTPFQAACFMSASYPIRCDWLALSEQLAAKPGPHA
ncbi:hypothetical protein WJX74_001913 [Apatococcus lobatus]|uniref:Uncharacterized protein n=1 Tax=Apatococcus lobatus TaxID=904363 RepID=A0AAW1RYH8_9CHLO